jgi:hypothetical protein
MRIVRKLALTLVAAVIPSLVTLHAQAARPFENSWFWGLKGGVTSFSTGVNGSGRTSAPTIGGEWLITRTRVALYASIDQSFFSKTANVFDPSATGSLRPVAIKDMRRYNLGLFAFPLRFGSLRPYAGLGLAINVIQNAQPSGTFDTPERQDSVFQRVADQSSRSSVVLTGGVQGQIGRTSIFVQGSSMPTRNNFLISGSSNTFLIEGGVRFNLLGAIEKF